MYIDCSKLPNPARPHLDDVFTSPDDMHTVVVLDVPEHAEDGDATAVIGIALNGLRTACPQGQLVGILASIGARPWGRLDRSGKARPRLSTEPEVVAERLAAMGPHLRALREQYGLSMGDFSRALGCPPARLSRLELADPDPVTGSSGVREDEGRAALAELMAETVRRVYVIHRGEGSDAFQADVWQELHGMLLTEPARAAMTTIAAARRAAVELQGTAAWERQLDVANLAGTLRTALLEDGVIDQKKEVAVVTCLTGALRTENALRFIQGIAAQVQPHGPFQVGDRVRHGQLRLAGEVEAVDVGEHLLVQVRYDKTDLPISEALVSPHDLELANENVATASARAGLALLLARVACKEFTRNSDEEIEQSNKLGEVQYVLEQALTGHEAQSLIRLHG